MDPTFTRFAVLLLYLIGWVKYAIVLRRELRTGYHDHFPGFWLWFNAGLGLALVMFWLIKIFSVL